jgi:phosphoinositide-3-kinase regulatory subunit 4
MSSLYDRLSTRPFLTNIEKRWVLYQLFRAVEDCHQEGFTHGDIKLENVLVSSWNWVVLTDFASFKPTYLPDDDPTDYNYYFDLSDRSRCAIAPERFRASDTASAADALNDFKVR